MFSRYGVVRRRYPFLLYFAAPFAVIGVRFHHCGKDGVLLADMVHHERGHSLPRLGRERHIARAAKHPARHRFYGRPPQLQVGWTLTTRPRYLNTGIRVFGQDRVLTLGVGSLMEYFP